MNKYQEALDAIISYAKSYLIVNGYTDEGKERHLERLEEKEKELRKLVDKTIPKKPYPKGEGEWHCPHCDGDNIFNYDDVCLNFCQDCGGKLSHEKST